MKEQGNNSTLHAICVHENLDFLLHSSLQQLTSDAQSRELLLNLPVQSEIQSEAPVSVTFPSHPPEVPTWLLGVLQDYMHSGHLASRVT